MKRKEGAEARTRTWDRLVTVTSGGSSAERRNSEALYQLSYFGSFPDTRVVLIWLSFPPDSGEAGWQGIGDAVAIDPRTAPPPPPTDTFSAGPREERV